MQKSTKAIWLAFGVISCATATAAIVHAQTVAKATWSDITTAAATGYCTSRHLYLSPYSGSFAPDGFELASAPGVVGAVRRNFVQKRTTFSEDQGANNTCAAACQEFGKLYGPASVGASLRQKTSSGALIASGIGDMASLAVRDRDFALGSDVVAGIWSRSNTWQEADVAQSDFCCCQAKSR
jgi:hypothetical protein